MFFAIAALLIQPQIVTQRSFFAEKIALIEPAGSTIANSAPVGDISLQPADVDANTSVTGSDAQPPTEASAAALSDAPAPIIEAHVNAAFITAKPRKPMTVSVSELQKEYHRNQMIWKGLVIASSGAATFDAWTTRHAITTQGAQELDPLLKPFAGNASLYEVIQVGPVLMDIAARKMMYSRHAWMRRMWWAPQTASMVGSLFCGAHNLSYHQ